MHQSQPHLRLHIYYKTLRYINIMFHITLCLMETLECGAALTDALNPLLYMCVCACVCAYVCACMRMYVHTYIDVDEPMLQNILTFFYTDYITE